MSVFGIAEAMPWDAEFRALFSAAPAAIVTDDLTPGEPTAGGSRRP